MPLSLNLAARWRRKLLSPRRCDSQTGAARQSVPRICGIALAAYLCLSAVPARAEDEAAVAELPETSVTAPIADSAMSVEQLTARMTPSIVVVTFKGRDGKQQGLGSGFIVSRDGLIATNLHVIGEGRPISVRMSDGKEYPVTEVHASDRRMDMALLRIDARNLPSLPLGDSSKLAQGERVATIGSPVGWKYSVVAGVLSGRREIDEMPMLQLAMPIEPGNSGGPLFDMFGRVHGIVTLKSLVTRNLGFAVEINALKPLLEKPNPIPMKRWLRLGTLDPRDWETRFGSTWKKRAGRIQVEGSGAGIGQRSIAISQDEVPEGPFEVGVAVKLAEDSGAAGLIVHSNGDDKHYGFYPSGGNLRFARFDGGDVFNWQVLEEVKSRHYRPGEWNNLKIRVDGNRFKCFVNDEAVCEVADGQYLSGKAGLVQFRSTKAEFRDFQIAKEIASSKPPQELVDKVTALVQEIAPDRPPEARLIDQLSSDGAAAADILTQRARMLDQQARRLRQLARSAQQHKARQALAKVMEQEEEEIDLLHAALLIARIDNEDLDVDDYLRIVERMAEDVKKSLPDGGDEAARLKALDRFLFEELGFHGSRTDYYSRSNSYLNEVVDDREGLPITMAVLYIDLARRIGLNVVGVGLPGHFIVRHEPKKGPSELIDVFDRGKRLSRDDAAKVVTDAGREFDEEHLVSQSKQQILIRMLRNLFGIARNAEDPEAMLQYTETVLVLDRHSAEDRWYRAALRYQTQRREEARADVDWLLEREPPGIDLSRVRQLKAILSED